MHINKHQLATEILGSIGRMEYPIGVNAITDVVVDDGYTPIWYGDINLIYYVDKLMELSKQTKSVINVRKPYYNKEVLMSFNANE